MVANNEERPFVSVVRKGGVQRKRSQQIKFGKKTQTLQKEAESAEEDGHGIIIKTKQNGKIKLEAGTFYVIPGGLAIKGRVIRGWHDIDSIQKY